jgi:multidrug transporter EmrE-like cation transporter
VSERGWDHLYIVLTIVLTVYGQLVVKWRIARFGQMPQSPSERVVWLLKLCFEPWIFSGFATAFLASLAWMATMTRFDLSYAYPFTSLCFVLVLLMSAPLLGESITRAKLAGVALIVAGTFVASHG